MAHGARTSDAFLGSPVQFVQEQRRPYRLRVAPQPEAGEHSLVPDIALVKAHIADRSGNLRFNLTARNFNPAAAMAGKICVVEVEEVVEPGALDPDCVHLPGVYVQRMILGAPYDKKIEFRTVRERPLENA